MAEVGDELERHLADFEMAIAKNDAQAARLAFRHYLFATLGSALDGSATEAVAALASSPAGRADATAVVLRALGAELLRDGKGRTEQVARHVVSLAETTLPELCNYLGVKPRSQNFEKLEVLRGAHEKIFSNLEPLRTPYQALDTIVSAKPRLMAALNHGQVRAYCSPYHLGEVAELVERLVGLLARAQRMEATVGSDVEACRREIASGDQLVALRPSFLTTDCLRPFLENASRALDSFLDGMHGRLAAEIVRADRKAGELQKRYPLHEEGRELRVFVPFRNDGPGTAHDVTFNISSPTDGVAVANETFSLGAVSPGEFSVALDVLVTGCCDSFDAEIVVGWDEVGGTKRREEIFGVRVLAQRADIDWSTHKFWNPYSTAPAEGAGFYGRSEQVETLVARLLQQPMEPSYITGQKRVGKTSLAKTSVEKAREQDPTGRMTTGYILWGRVSHDDPKRALRQLGEEMERIIVSALDDAVRPVKGDYDGTLAPLFNVLDLALAVDPTRRFVVILDEFDEMPEDLYLKGNLAETLFANIRALTTTANFCVLLVGGENMPFVMERQGQKLNKFNRVNLTYFSRVAEWDDFVRLIRGPTEGVLTWHTDAVAEVFNLTNGNPYFSKIICKGVTARAVAERDGDVTVEEVRRAVRDGIAGLDTNAFMHLWEDGTRSPLEERETLILKRRRTLAAVARCLRAGRPATTANILAHRGATEIDERELGPVLLNFVDRGVLVEGENGYDISLPIFRMWLIEVGLSRLANDGLTEELASIEQQLEDEAYVQSGELVNLTAKWKPYRGTQVGPEAVRAWLVQRKSNREQRLLFEMLQAVRVVGQDEIFTRLRQAGQVIREALGVPTRRSKAERRSDVVLTYVDGEGKSGQRYAAQYAEENKIDVGGILPPSSFKESFEAFQAKYGVPKALVIVDDIVATGGTLSEKITTFVQEHCALLDEAQLLIELYSLFATDAGRTRVQETLTDLPYPNLNFRAGEVLAPSLFAFHEPRGVFDSADNRDRAKALATDIGVTIYRGQPLGVGGHALLLVLPETVPNNSLPLLHSASKDAERPWRPLFERIANG